ncbi:hypothetical protein AB0M02_32820 [Actinoplanes sp. NPDC051861]|uniref:hypothetical protein n=1 Tax=Actinoplanes sp. NPDC051861 TaxID=3155170 RepID=UPI00342EB1ED
MNGRIGMFRCRYRVVRPRIPAAAAVRPIERVARGTLMVALSEALDAAFGTDPHVYVVRRVHVALTHDLADPDGLAGRWSRCLARAVTATIASEPADVVRFDDDAHFRAAFLADLVTGVAWDRWYYGAFTTLRDRDTAGIVRRVLLDADGDAPAVLARLHTAGALGRVLAHLDTESQEQLRRAGLEPPSSASPLVETAMRLADRMGWWTGPRPAGNEVLAAFLATAPPPANWRDRTELTNAVLAVLRLLEARGDLRLPDDASAGIPLPGLDWLDGPVPRGDLPVRPPGSLTPRQQRVLTGLRRTWRPGLLPPGPPGTPANALTLAAALTAADSSWAGDVTATAMISQLLSAAGAHARGEPITARWAAEAPDLVEIYAAARPAVPVSPCAGTYVLLPAITDAQLPALSRDPALPPLGLIVLALAVHWSGPAAVTDGRVDPALCLLAGADTGLPAADLRAALDAVPAPAARDWSARILGAEGGEDGMDRAIAAVGDRLLRDWARWLRGFGSSTSEYLLTTFVRRPGRVVPDGPDLIVELEPRPLDQVLALAGYLDDWDATPLLAGHVRFRGTPS